MGLLNDQLIHDMAQNLQIWAFDPIKYKMNIFDAGIRLVEFHEDLIDERDRLQNFINELQETINKLKEYKNTTKSAKKKVSTEDEID